VVEAEAEFGEVDGDFVGFHHRVDGEFHHEEALGEEHLFAVGEAVNHVLGAQVQGAGG